MPRTLRTLLRLAGAATLLAAVAVPALAQGEHALLGPSRRPDAALRPIDPQVARQRPVHVDARPLAERAATGGMPIVVELFDGERIVVDPFHVERRGEDDYTYFGTVRGRRDGEAVLTFVDGHLAADITLDDERAGTKALRIRSHPGAGHWLEELADDAFPRDHDDEGEEDAPASEQDALSGDLTSGTTGALALTTTATTTIDLLVVYSSKTATAAGSAIGSQIQAAVDRANLAYANSALPIRLRLVHRAALSYAESSDLSTNLSRLANASDGHMDSVHTLRNTYGADVVSLFIESSSACGVAYVGPGSTTAFSVVKRTCASSNLSLAHEIAHNFGARHDPYVDSRTTPYAYGHGHVNVTYRWRTVMAYNNKCAAAGTNCTRIAHFSNPAVRYGSAGSPTGTTSTSDNARVLRTNASLVAGYRATRVTSGTSTAADGSGTSGDDGDRSPGRRNGP
jgi:hypothetical protein